jgi:hypothetical protein
VPRATQGRPAASLAFPKMAENAALFGPQEKRPGTAFQPFILGKGVWCQEPFGPNLPMEQARNMPQESPRARPPWGAGPPMCPLLPKGRALSS